LQFFTTFAFPRATFSKYCAKCKSVI